MSNIKFPLILIEDDHELHFYKSIEDALGYIEAIDVNEGVYQGFDAKGRLLKLVTKDQSIHISLAEETPSHTEELKQRLRNFLTAKAKPIDQADLQTLVNLCNEYLFVPPKKLGETLKDLLKRIF